MAGVEPLPEPPKLAVELERPAREKRDEEAHGHGIDRGDMARLEAQAEGRRDEPQSDPEREPFAADMIATEAEMRCEREPEAADCGIGGRCILSRVIGDPRRNGEPEPEREARPVLPTPHLAHRVAHPVTLVGHAPRAHVLPCAV